MVLRERCGYVLVLKVLLIQLSISLNVYAHDLFFPEGRGRAGTTYQHWRFDTDANPLGPEQADNPYGQAVATITLGQFSDGWYDTVSFGSLTGIWDLGREGTIVVDIPNVSVAPEYTEVRIQITYFDSITGAPLIEVYDAQFMSSQTAMVEQDLLGEWILYQGTWRAEGGQAPIEITVTSSFNGSTIDQIVVDTSSTGACFVDYEDLDVLCSQWLDIGEGLTLDLNDSNCVDTVDFAILARHWFDPCPPEWPVD